MPSLASTILTFTLDADNLAPALSDHPTGQSLNKVCLQTAAPEDLHTWQFHTC